MDRRGKSKVGRRDYYIVFDRVCGGRDGEGYSRSGTPFPYVVSSDVFPATPQLNLKTVICLSVLPDRTLLATLLPSGLN